MIDKILQYTCKVTIKFICNNYYASYARYARKFLITKNYITCTIMDAGGNVHVRGCMYGKTIKVCPL